MFDGDDTVLVIGAHPDDEVLGAGGTVAKHAASGDTVHILIVTEGTTQQYDDGSLIELKRDHARNCAERLGAEKVHFGDLPDMRLRDIDHVTINTTIEDVCDSVNPDIVYTHSRREANVDHVAVHDSTVVATRPGAGVNKVLAYETPSSTDFAVSTNGFTPSLFVNIHGHLDTKVEAFQMYETEVREFPHSRSAEALRAIAKTRGVASGVPAAEAFDVLREYH